MVTELNTMELLWNILHTATTCAERRTTYNKMVKLYKSSDVVKGSWKHHPSKHLFVERFEKIARTIVKVVKKVFDDGKDYYNLPNWGGLYLLGETDFDADTDEKHYWIKVGLASHMKERLSSYNTCCAMYHRIDLLRINNSDKRRKSEKMCHNVLSQIGLASCNHNEEWFLVTKEIYMAIRAQGFNFFFPAEQ